MSSENITAGLAVDYGTQQITATIPRGLLVLLEKISRIEFQPRNRQLAQFVKKAILQYMAENPAVVPALETELEKLNKN